MRAYLDKPLRLSLTMSTPAPMLDEVISQEHVGSDSQTDNVVVRDAFESRGNYDCLRAPHAQVRT